MLTELDVLQCFSLTTVYRFFVSCWAPMLSADHLNATVSGSTTHTFIESDGVLDDTIYLCVVHQAFDGDYTAASDPVYFTSLLNTSKL